MMHGKREWLGRWWESQSPRWWERFVDVPIVYVVWDARLLYWHLAPPWAQELRHTKGRRVPLCQPQQPGLPSPFRCEHPREMPRKGDVFPWHHMPPCGDRLEWAALHRA